MVVALGGGKHQDHKSHDQPGHSQTTPWHLLGHRSPAVTYCDGQARKREQELNAVVHEEHQDSDKEERSAPEARIANARCRTVTARMSSPCWFVVQVGPILVLRPPAELTRLGDSVSSDSGLG